MNENSSLLSITQKPIKEFYNNPAQRHLHIIPSPMAESQEMAQKIIPQTPVSAQDSYKSYETSTSESGLLLLQTTNLLLNKKPYHDTLNISKECWTDSSFYNRDKTHTLSQVDDVHIDHCHQSDLIQNQSSHCQPVQPTLTIVHDKKNNIEQNNYCSASIEVENNDEEDDDLSDAFDKENSVKAMGPIISTEGINDSFLDYFNTNK